MKIHSFSLAAVLFTGSAFSSLASAFAFPPIRMNTVYHNTASTLLFFSSQATDADDFTSFETTLDVDSRQVVTRKFSTKQPVATQKSTWQSDLERLLDPMTSVAQRQILLSNLLNANEEIRTSVQEAFRDRKVRIFRLMQFFVLFNACRYLIRRCSIDRSSTYTYRTEAAGRK